MRDKIEEKCACRGSSGLLFLEDLSLFLQKIFCILSFCSFPEGLQDVSHYPDLFTELALRGWTEAELQKLAGLNLLRVFKAVELVRFSAIVSLFELSRFSGIFTLSLLDTE